MPSSNLKRFRTGNKYFALLLATFCILVVGCGREVAEENTESESNQRGFVSSHAPEQPSISESNGVVTMLGTNFPDKIVAYKVGSRLIVSITTKDTQGRVKFFVSKILQFNDVKKIVMHGYGGDDLLSMPEIAKIGELYGGDGNDEIQGGNMNDAIYGGSGSDYISSGSGDDQVYGGDGNDTLKGEGGNDYLVAGKGDDYLYGGDGNDTLRGGDGLDAIRGNEGDDDINGQAGQDMISDGEGSNTITAQVGDWVNGKRQK